VNSDGLAPPVAGATAGVWALEHFDAKTRNMVRFRLCGFPCRIGRPAPLDSA
jgi:hypothetical protein